MGNFILFLANLLSVATPQTRLFTLRGFVYRLAGVTVARTAKINGTARIHHPNVHIGADTWLGAGTHLIATADTPVIIADRCDIGPGVMMVTGSHELAGHARRAGRGAPDRIVVGEGTWVGARATLIAGATVGNGCMVAAGSLVRGSFPNDVLIAGVPARIIRHL